MTKLFFNQPKSSSTLLSKTDFKLIEQLGINRSCGRITYQALEKKTGQNVVIKKFKFLEGWDGYKLVKKETDVLSTLNHPNIPKFLGKYEDHNSIGLIQEYIEAPSLAAYGKLATEEVKQIALDILDILVYLQRLNPPIFHRDIKPSNILYNQLEKKVYLIDFGSAKKEITLGESTRIEGTPGFIPPEQIQGKELTLSSDLYSLGISLVCLISGTSISEINQLINHQFEVDFSKVVPVDLSWQFKDWLKRMVNPDPTQRFSSALEAKKALETIPGTIPSKKVATVGLIKPTTKKTVNPRKKRILRILFCPVQIANLILYCSSLSYFFSLLIAPFITVWESLKGLEEGSVSISAAWKTLDFLRFTPPYADLIKHNLYLWVNHHFLTNSLYEQNPFWQLLNFFKLSFGNDWTQGLIFAFCTFFWVIFSTTLMIFSKD